jgi:hypothetical protein
MKIIKLEHTTYPLLCKQIEKAKKALLDFPKSNEDEGVSSEKAVKEMRNYLHKLRQQNRQVSHERTITVSFGRQFKNKKFNYTIVPHEKELPPKRAAATPTPPPAAYIAATGIGTAAHLWQTTTIPELRIGQPGTLGGLNYQVELTGAPPRRTTEVNYLDDEEAGDEEVAPEAKPQTIDYLYEAKRTLKQMKSHMKKLRDEQKHIRTWTRSRPYKGNAVIMTYTGLHRTPVREEFGYFMHFKKRQAAKTCFEDKFPADDAKHLGIELELCTKLEAGKLAVLFSGQGLENYVTIKEDHSLRANTGHYAYEICVLFKEDEATEVVNKLTAVLNNPVVDAYVNETCGMHLHLDMRTRKVDDCYRKLYKAQKFLVETQPPCRMETNFCNLNERGSMQEQMGLTGTNPRDRAARYLVINPLAFNTHKTLEIRSHSGTTNATKILNWIALCKGLIDGEDSATAAPYSMLKTLKDRANLSEEVVKYLKERIAKFKKYYNDNENTDVSIIKKSKDINDGRRGMLNKPMLTIEEMRATDIRALPEPEGYPGMGNTQTV